MRKILILFAGLLLMQPVLPHYKAKYHVVVDTDGGIDDFRALCMLLASPEIEVIAVTAVDGILSPDKTAERVSALLRYFGHEGIPVGEGNAFAEKTNLLPGAAGFAEKVRWPGTEAGNETGDFPSAVEMIRKSADLEEMPVDFVALGPLSNVASALRAYPSLADDIRKIVWYGEDSGGDGFNYRFDTLSAGRIVRSGFDMDMVYSGGSMISDLQGFLNGLDTLTSAYAAAICDFYEGEKSSLPGHYMGNHLGDDCIPLYLLYPEYFTVRERQPDPVRRVAEAGGSHGLLQAVRLVLDSDKEDKSIIFKSFPVDTGLFEEDVAAIAGEAIEKHGKKEWKILVMTNEFHEHLGIYSVIGAKMGLRAREYFNVGIDELRIESFAGSNPPVSCLNDGLQVSTGATLGHGTIVVLEEDEGPVPAARFMFKDRTVELSVKKEIRDEIREKVSEGVRQFGSDSPEYWDYIRALALKYWIELSRREIFEIR